MPIEGSNEKPKSSFAESIMKIFFIALIVLTAFVIVFGFVLQQFDPITFIINAAVVAMLAGLISLAIKGLLAFLKPKPFSPTEDFRNSLIRIATKLKPFNVYNLYLRGEDMRTHAKWGKISGLGFLPYVTSMPVRDKTTGKSIMELDDKGKMVYEKEWSKGHNGWINIPKKKFENITEKDGDVVFVVERNSFPLSLFFRDIDIIRAHKNYCSDLIGDIYIKAVNLVNYGEYLYPSQQWQSDIKHIMMENEATAIIATHRNNLDLVSTVTQMSLGADPTFQKIMTAQSERLTSGLGNQGGT